MGEAFTFEVGSILMRGGVDLEIVYFYFSSNKFSKVGVVPLLT